MVIANSSLPHILWSAPDRCLITLDHFGRFIQLFAIDNILRTGYTKDAVLPKAIATAVVEFVVDQVRDKLLRGWASVRPCTCASRLGLSDIDHTERKTSHWTIRPEKTLAV